MSSKAAALAQSLLNGESIAKVVALSFDLECADELYDLLTQAATTRRIELERTNANVFPDLSIAVETALQNLPLAKHANQVAADADTQLQTLDKACAAQQEALARARAVADECVGKLHANAEAQSWVSLALQAQRLTSIADALECLQRLEAVVHLRKEPLAVELYTFAATRIAEISASADQGLITWATEAIEHDGEVGAQVLNSAGSAPRLPAVDAVVSFLHVNKRLGRFESALERYRDARLPALAQARRAALAQRTLGGLCDAVQRVTGFFTIETRVTGRGFSLGELGELWADTVDDVHRALEAALAHEGEGMVRLFLLVAAMPLKSARLLNTLVTNRSVLAKALVHSAGLVPVKNDAPLPPSHDLFASGVRQGFEPTAGGALPLSSVVVVTLDLCVQVWRDAQALQRRFGAFSASNAADVEASSLALALECARAINKRLAAVPDALHVVLCAHLLSVSLARALAKAGAQVHDDDVAAIFQGTLQTALSKAMADNRSLVSFTIGEYAQTDWAPPLNDATVLAPTPEVLTLVDCLVQLFASAPIRRIAASIVAQLKHDCASALEDALLTPLTRPGAQVNPVGVRRLALDLDVARDWAGLPRLAAVLKVLSVNGALEAYCRQPGRDAAETALIVQALGSFVELDASSRLFAPEDKKSQILDLRESAVKRAAALLKSG